MKGTIFKCMEEVVVAKFGRESWKAILRGSGLPDSKIFTLTENVDEAMTAKVLDVACRTLKVTPAQLGDAFGTHWAVVYAPSIYKTFYGQAKSAREFLLNMDKLHTQVTATVKDARPPRFKFDWRDERTLVITYASPRNLGFLVVGLAEGVGKYFKEKVKARLLDPTHIEVTFG